MKDEEGFVPRGEGQKWTQVGMHRTEDFERSTHGRLIAKRFVVAKTQKIKRIEGNIEHFSTFFTL